MQRSRCFLGASFEPRGALLAIGGGTGLYVDDEAFETIEVLRPGEETAFRFLSRMFILSYSSDGEWC